jgi:cell division protein FtsL
MILRIILAVLIVANVITALGVVNARHQYRQLYVEQNRLTHIRDELNIEFGRLQLEQATWAESNRIDQVARTKLGMKFPETADIVVIRP